MWLQRKQNSYNHTRTARTCDCPSIYAVPNSGCNLPRGQSRLPQSNDPHSSVSDSLRSQLAFTLVCSLQTFILLILQDLFCFAKRILLRRSCGCSAALFAALAWQRVAGKLHSESDSPTEVLNRLNKYKMTFKMIFNLIFQLDAKLQNQIESK